MEPARNSNSTPAETNFAKPDTADSHSLKVRIAGCLRDRNRDFQHLHVTVFGGTVVVRGELPSLAEKGRCLEFCRLVPGVMRVVDELIVADSSPVSHDSDGNE
jgi:hypothetical protein